MIETINSFPDWFGPFFSALFTVGWDLLFIALKSAFWVMCCMRPLACIAMALAYLLEACQNRSGRARGPLFIIAGVSATIVSLVVVIASFTLGGIGNFVWGQIAGMELLEDWRYGHAVKSTIGLIVSALLCFGVLALNGGIFGILEQSTGPRFTRVLMTASLILLITGYIFPVGFLSIAQPVRQMATKRYNKFTGHYIPDDLKGAVFSGEVRFVPFQPFVRETSEFVTIGFFNDIPCISFDGTPLPCRILGNSIIVKGLEPARVAGYEGLQNHNVFLDLEIDQSGEHIYYRSHAWVGESRSFVAHEGLLHRTEKQLSDIDFVDQMTNPSIFQ